MSGDYIKDALLKKLSDPNERAKAYSDREYSSLRNRALRRLVREIGSSPAWITLLGSVVSGLFYANWLLAIDYWSSRGGVSESEREILNTLGNTSVSSMVAFILVFILGITTACLMIMASVDQYKLRKGLDNCGEAQPHREGFVSSSEKEVSGFKIDFNQLVSIIYLILSVGIFSFFSSFSFLLILNEFRSPHNVEISILLANVLLSLLALYHVKTLTRRNGQFKLRRRISSVAAFVLVSFATCASIDTPISHAPIVFVYTACGAFTLIWFVTNGVAYALTLWDSRTAKSPKQEEAAEEMRALSRWLFRDLKILGATVLLEIPLLFFLEIAICRLLVILFDLLYSAAPVVLNVA